MDDDARIPDAEPFTCPYCTDVVSQNDAKGHEVLDVISLRDMAQKFIVTMCPKAPRCEICGDPATSFARDFISRPDRTFTYMELEPIGHVKAGCDKHPAKSVTFESARVYPWAR